MITLETQRLLLRMWKEDDLEAYADICADPEIMRYLETVKRSTAQKPGGKCDDNRPLAFAGLWDLGCRRTRDRAFSGPDRVLRSRRVAQLRNRMGAGQISLGKRLCD